jgi:uncharacterized protein YecE (DUF72 family)
MQNLHLGTIGWSYNFWKSKFYPKKTPAKDYLAYYATQFNTVEVDNTFYRIPTQQTVTNWKQQTPEDFQFSLKFPQLITHVKMLKNCKYETDVFLERVNLLREKLGPLLLQFPSNFGVEHMPDLTSFLSLLPEKHRYAVEIRNKSWLNLEFYSILRDRQVALAWADSSLMSEISEVTADFLYVRWEGDRKKVNGTLGKIETNRIGDLKLEAEKIKPYLTKRAVFGYFGKYYSGYPPSDIVNLKSFLNLEAIRISSQKPKEG